MQRDRVRQLVLNNRWGRAGRNYRNLVGLVASGRLRLRPAPGESTLNRVVRRVYAAGMAPHHDFILRRLSYDLAQKLETQRGATFDLDAEGRLLARLDGLTVRLQSLDDLVAFSEVFGGRLYQFETERPVVVWDVGMHVGFASLFFAQLPQVVHVVACEPFAPTYQAGQANLALNPGLAGKITAHPYGLSDWTGSAEVAYDQEYKAGVGLAGLPKGVAAGLSSTRERIAIRDAVAVFEELRAAYPGLEVVAKIDCEGEEYKIVPALQRSGALAHIGLIMMEWHHHGPAPLTQTLAASGFQVALLDDATTPIGMLRATAGRFAQPVAAG